MDEWMKMKEEISPEQMRTLRESTGMNRREFCEYFSIPYRTVEEWENGKRRIAGYVYRLMEYQIRMEELMRKKEEK